MRDVECYPERNSEEMNYVDRLISGGLFGALSAVVAICGLLFSASLGQYRKTVDKPQPPDYPVLGDIVDSLKRCRFLFACLAIIVSLVIIILTPAIIQISTSLSPSKDFSALRALLCLYCLLLVGIETAACVLISGISKKVSRLKRRIADLGGRP